MMTDKYVRRQRTAILLTIGFLLGMIVVLAIVLPALNPVGEVCMPADTFQQLRGLLEPLGVRF